MQPKVSKDQVIRLLKYLLYGILIVLLFFQLYHGAMLSVDAHHDGTMFNPAYIIAKGGVMYKDTATYYGVLTTYIQALFLLVFGKTVWAMRLSAVVFYVLSFIVYFNIFKRLMPRTMVILSEIILLYIAAFWMTTFHAWSSVYALFFILCYMYFCILYFEKGQLKYIGMLGLTTAIIFWSRTPGGIVFILVSFILLMLLRLFNWNNSNQNRAAVYWLIGFIIGMLPFLVTIIIQGTFLTWWTECIKGPFLSTFKFRQKISQIGLSGLMLTGGSGGNGSAIFSNLKNLLTCLFPLNNSGIYIILPIANLYIFFKTFISLYRSRKIGNETKSRKQQLMIVTLSLCALGSWHQYFAVSDVRHWYWAGFPMFGILTYLIYQLFDNSNVKWHIILSYTALVTISLTTLYERYSDYEIRKERYTEEISEDICPILKGIKLSSEQLEFYEDYCNIMEELAEAHPSRRIENRTFSRLLQSIDNNDRDTIDNSKQPIIVSNIKSEPEADVTHVLAVEIEQKYPEQELDPRQWTIRIFTPMEWIEGLDE